MTTGDEVLVPAVLRGFRRLLEQVPGDAVVSQLNRHGLTCLVDYCLGDACPSPPGAYAEPLRAEIAAAARDYAAQAMAWRHEWHQMLQSLQDRGIQVLLLKGAALAGSLYPEWHHRMLGDLDLLVHPDQVERARSVLHQQGYRQPTALSGDLVFSQIQLRKPLTPALMSSVDLHWALSNRHLLGGLFGWEELHQARMTSRGSQRLGPTHALLHACIHRTGHHRGFERLVWLLDIHLLWQSAGVRQREFAVQLALTKGIGGLLRDGLENAAAAYDTTLDAGVLATLARAAGRERAQIFLRQRHPAVQDLSTLPDWSSRVRYLRQVAFPDPGYMRQRYPGSGPLLLLYLRRLWSGLTGQTGRRH